jgi:hypothetical protein
VTRHRRRCGGIERFTGLAILAALSIVAAVLQAVQAIGHLSALGLLAAAVDAAFQGGRKWERRRPQLRVWPRARAPRKSCQKPPAATVEARAATSPPAGYGQDKEPTDERSAKRADRGSLLADPGSSVRPLSPFRPATASSPAPLPFHDKSPCCPGEFGPRAFQQRCAATAVTR